MKLTHLGVSYYRSIGAEPVTIDLSKKITVLVGANNCGKSNVLGALKRMCEENERSDFAEIDFHGRLKSIPPSFRFSAAPETDSGDVSLVSLGHFTVGWNGAAAAQFSRCSCDDLDRMDFHAFNAIFDAFARQRFNRVVDLERRR